MYLALLEMHLIPLLWVSTQSVFATSHPEAFTPSLPTVHLDSGTFIGNESNGITQFLGIPFAESTYVTIHLRASRSLTCP